MKKMMIVLALLLSGSFASAQYYGQDAYTNGYFKQDGSYVNGYHHTKPDNNPYNNYSTYGNTNPYTGKAGTVQPYGNDYSYGSNHRRH